MLVIGWSVSIFLTFDRNEFDWTFFEKFNLNVVSKITVDLWDTSKTILTGSILSSFLIKLSGMFIAFAGSSSNPKLLKDGSR